MKKIVVLVIVLLTYNLYAADRPMLKETAFAEVSKQIGTGKAIFLEVGSDSCRSCRVMGKLLYTVRQEHPAYPIYFVNVKKEREAAFKLKIQMIPTQIVLDGKGIEVFRHVGILSPDELNALLEKYIQ